MQKDVKVKNLGSMIIIICQSARADNWWTENVSDAESIELDGGVACDHRMGRDILDGMSLEGMTLDMS